MKRTLAIVCVGAALCAAGPLGCAKDEGTDRASAKRDRHPEPVGRLEIDQSAVLPVDVKAGVMKEYPGATVQKVNKRTFDDRVVRYEVTLTTKDGRQVTRQFDEDGKPSAAK